MGHNVYANSRSVAAKKASGRAIGFPDVCFSPPQPVKIGIPIPYPNIAFAKNTKKGSKSVKIGKRPIVKRNKSLFSTSYGDEVATPLYKKGLLTNTIKGKCYFKSWSMNVFVERRNVCRHFDLTTHNHKK